MQYYHVSSGRLRIKIPAMRQNKVLAGQVEAAILGVEGVTSCRAKIITGSVVIHFDPRIADARQIVAPLEEEGHFDLGSAQTFDECLRDCAHRASQALLKFAFKTALESSPLSPLAALL